MGEQRPKTGLLLINLGTPAAPEPDAVGRYLREFLMDPLVIKAPKIIRWFLVNVLIVPRRRHASAALYQKIWLKNGSPLLVYTQQLAQKVQQKMSDRYSITVGMRYGAPSIEQAINNLLKQNVTSLVIFPLYPQYAAATVQTSVDLCNEILKKKGFQGSIRVVPAFFDHPQYIAALSNSIAEFRKTFAGDHLVMSFHGLPEAHIRNDDPQGNCLNRPDCCLNFRQSAPHCYRAQCFATAAAVAEKLGLSTQEYTVSFQSRLGPTRWIQPYTEEVIKSLAQNGIKKLIIASPAFTADCLETLEELSIRAREEFLHAGGEDLRVVPSLNDRDDWVATVADIATGNSSDNLGT